MSSSRIFIAWYPLNALCERGIAEKDATGNLQLTANGTLMRPFLSVTSIPPARQLSGGTSCRTPPTDLILPPARFVAAARTSALLHPCDYPGAGHGGPLWRGRCLTPWAVKSGLAAQITVVGDNHPLALAVGALVFGTQRQP